MSWSVSSEEDSSPKYTVKAEDFSINKDANWGVTDTAKGAPGLGDAAPATQTREENVFYSKIGFEVGNFFVGEKMIHDFNSK